MSKFSNLQDSPEGRRRRQQKRRQALNDVALKIGCDSWSQLETAVLHGDIVLAKAEIVDLQPNKKYWLQASEE